MARFFGCGHKPTPSQPGGNNYLILGNEALLAPMARDIRRGSVGKYLERDL